MIKNNNYENNCGEENIDLFDFREAGLSGVDFSEAGPSGVDHKIAGSGAIDFSEAAKGWVKPSSREGDSKSPLRGYLVGGAEVGTEPSSSDEVEPDSFNVRFDQKGAAIGYSSTIIPIEVDEHLSASLINPLIVSDMKKVKEYKGKKEVSVKSTTKGGKGGKQEIDIKIKEGNTCSVCCESYSSVIRKKIECPKCEYKCCKKCLEFYLLSSIKNTPNCMNCNLEFSSAFLFEKTSKIFGRDRYIEKRAMQVLNDQKNLLPATLISYNKKKEIKKRQDDITKELIYIKKRQNELIWEFNKLRNKNDYDLELDEKLNRPCPVNECKGYLSSAWKCGLCDMYVCHECGNLKGKRTDEEHVCNEDDKKSMILLKKDTKPCPGCFKYIHKIEGCDQMFCVGCHTVFSWNSGKKLHGVVCHNPHYYEYQRKINGGEAPRVAGDVPYNICADNEMLPGINQVRRRLFSLFSTHNWEIIEKIHMSVYHNDDVVINPIARKIGNAHSDSIYKIYREKYLEPTVLYTEENWMSNIKSEIKKIEKYKQEKMVYDMVKVVIVDIFIKMMNLFHTLINDVNAQEEFMHEFQTIRTYANSQLCIIYENYGTKVYMYNDKFILQ